MRALLGLGIASLTIATLGVACSSGDEDAAGSAGSFGGSAGSGGAGEAGAAGGAPLGTLTLSGLQISANPKMSLGCYVSWTTEQPANSEVRFSAGGPVFQILDAKEVTEHRLYVIGMHAQTAYSIQAISTSSVATGSAQGTFTTGALPQGLPGAAELVSDVPGKVQRGWTLTNLQVGTGQRPALIVIVDESALPVWYYVHGSAPDTRGDVSTSWLAAEKHVLVGGANATPPVELDLEGNLVWTGPAQPAVFGVDTLTHHTSKLSNGDYIVTKEGTPGNGTVQELTASNQVVWSWSLFDHIPTPPDTTDWCHLNAVTIDEAGDFLYLNCRYQGLFKADRHGSGSVLWQMGVGIDSPNAGDVTYLASNAVRPNDTHDPELHDDGSVLFYDNEGDPTRIQGAHNGSLHSRVVEYQLDQTSQTATLTWEFPGTFAVDSWYAQEWFTPIWGDADRLANGDVLVTAGKRGIGTQTRLFEVTRAGEVVWAMAWPDNNGSYRADRISPTPVTELP